MRSHARVVVIGGGVVGVSTLYHLTKRGWTDVVLLERTELTAGSTWHAAGLLPLFNMSYTVGQLHKYSVDLYKRLPAETGQDVSFHVTGNLRLATCRERMDEYRKYCGTANTIGVPFHVITPQEVRNSGRSSTSAVTATRRRSSVRCITRTTATSRRRTSRWRCVARRASAGAEIHEQTEVTAARAHGRVASGSSRPTAARSSPSTWSARPATTRARRAACSASTCRRFRSSTSTSCTTSRPS